MVHEVNLLVLEKSEQDSKEFEYLVNYLKKLNKSYNTQRVL